LLGELDEWRDDFDRKIDAARSEMRRLSRAAIVGTRAYQRRIVVISVALLAIAAALGLTVAAAVTFGLVRPVRHLLLGTPQSRAAPSILWSRLPRATKSAG